MKQDLEANAQMMMMMSSMILTPAHTERHGPQRNRITYLLDHLLDP